MRREENGAALFFQIEDDVADFAPTHGVEPGRGLIEKNHLRIVQDGLRDSDALHHSLREFAELHVGGRG